MAVRELSSTPRLATLYPRAAAGPLLQRLPGFGSTELPDRELALVNAKVERDHVNAYRSVCGFAPAPTLPPTYPHILAFPLAMRLMTDRRFPFPAMGLVHVRNRIELLRPLRPEERLTLRVRAVALARHERGTQFDIVAEAMADGETVWQGVSTYLHRERGGSGSGGDRERSAPPAASAYWDIAGDVGRRYAAVSGDRNPIHMHPLAARLFGFPRAIAHGMWLKARALAELGADGSEAVAADAAFKLPLLLPARVAFARAPAGLGEDFSVSDAGSGRPHLSGSLRPGEQVAAALG